MDNNNTTTIVNVQTAQENNMTQTTTRPVFRPWIRTTLTALIFGELRNKLVFTNGTKVTVKEFADTNAVFDYLKLKSLNAKAGGMMITWNLFTTHGDECKALFEIVQIWNRVEAASVDEKQSVEDMEAYVAGTKPMKIWAYRWFVKVPTDRQYQAGIVAALIAHIN